MYKINGIFFIIIGLLMGFACLEIGSFGLLFLCPIFVALGILNLLHKVKREDDDKYDNFYTENVVINIEYLEDLITLEEVKNIEEEFNK